MKILAVASDDGSGMPLFISQHVVTACYVASKPDITVPVILEKFESIKKCDPEQYKRMA